MKEIRQDIFSEDRQYSEKEKESNMRVRIKEERKKKEGKRGQRRKIINP